MNLADAVRLTEALLALALIQQSLEHLAPPRPERLIFGLRLAACVWLLSGIAAPWAVAALFLFELMILHRYQGPYNGGSSKMTVLIVTCLLLHHIAPTEQLSELAVAYLAVQLVLSYFVSGYIKVINPRWRSGAALCDVFRYSAYPVSEQMRGWADRPQILGAMSWGVMGFEVLFPLALFHPLTLVAALFVGASFHLSNAFFFGLNRFFWIWLCAYPSLIWFQARIF